MPSVRTWVIDFFRMGPKPGEGKKKGKVTKRRNKREKERRKEKYRHTVIR